MTRNDFDNLRKGTEDLNKAAAAAAIIAAPYQLKADLDIIRSLKWERLIAGVDSRLAAAAILGERLIDVPIPEELVGEVSAYYSKQQFNVMTMSKSIAFILK